MEVKIMNMILRNHFFDSFFNNFGTYERSTSHRSEEHTSELQSQD